jgi:hypothetical protein
MLNGRFDYFFLTASSQEPLFELFGTLPEQSFFALRQHTFQFIKRTLRQDSALEQFAS